MKYLFLVFSIFLGLASCSDSVLLGSPSLDTGSNLHLDIVELSATELADRIARGDLSTVAVAEAFIERMNALDPHINAIITINPKALDIATQMDAEAKAGQLRGRLHGVPVLVKDNIEVAGMATTAGSLALVRNHTGRDAPIIARLKAEGALILAKTNLSEWANFRSNNSISGWSAVGGQTFNPYSLDRSPCGSSSGSAAAVAARFAPLAIGTETNGSIICPAGMNGVFGFKPSLGLLPRTHIVPISYTQDTAGPMTRSVEDAALMLSIMAGPDPGDALSSKTVTMLSTEPLLAAINRPVNGERVGVLRFAQGNQPKVNKAFERALATLRALGVETIDVIDYQTPEDFWRHALNVLTIEFKHYLNQYLSSTPLSVDTRTLEELIRFNTTDSREMVLFDQGLFLQSQAALGIESASYQESLEFVRTATQAQGIDFLMQTHGVSVLVAPSNPAAFLIDTVYGDTWPDNSLGAGWMAAIAGYPSATLPMGQVQGLPVGLGIISGAGQDAVVLQFARAYEQAAQPIPGPQFYPSARENPASAQALRAYFH